MRALVTGGSGFFGHLLVERLLARGDSVRNFDLTPADDEPAGVDFHQGDIRHASAVRRACEGIHVV
jgi:nucleoside-diphosphate-sugar epimerase